MDGCSRQNNPTHQPGSVSGYYSVNLQVAEIVCCSKNGASCSRKLPNNKCRSGHAKHEDKKVTWEFANAQCESEGLRLCTSQEELDRCCGTGCWYDFKAVWTGNSRGKYFQLINKIN